MILIVYTLTAVRLTERVGIEIVDEGIVFADLFESPDDDANSLSLHSSTGNGAEVRKIAANEVVVYTSNTGPGIPPVDESLPGDAEKSANADF